MADETHERRLSGRDGADEAYERTPIIFFVTDASAESAHLADTLRVAGYLVADVPLSMLVTRAQVQRPNVVLVDVDAASALSELSRLRRIPGGGAIDFVYLGNGAGPIRSAHDAASNDASAFFRRPVEVGALVRRVEALTGGPLVRPPRVASPSSPPLPPSRVSSVPPARPSRPSMSVPGLRAPAPLSGPSLAELAEPPRPLATFGVVSNELQQLLAEAERRAAVATHPDAPLPSPEDEIEAVLPADVLASLDEPIEGDEDEENEPRVRSGTEREHESPGPQGRQTTVGGSRNALPGEHGRGVAHDRRAPVVESTVSPVSSQPPSRGSWPSSPPPRGTWPSSPPSRVEPSLLPRTEQPSPVPSSMPDLPRSERIDDSVTLKVVGSLGALNQARVAREPGEPGEGGSSSPMAASVILHSVDARRFVAEAISRRLSGAICFEYDRVVRRIVVREGDLVTAASGEERESLVCFLGARGELPRDEVERLVGKVPPYGRHAGAALVAHGWLRQNQLWSALRAHAEWIATSVLRVDGGTVQFEPELPGRLRSEPSVFAASTGPEIFVELVRRAVSPEEAISALGGKRSRVNDGPTHSLLAECALPPAELDLVSRARGVTLGDLLARSADSEVASVVHSLALLGVLEVIPAVDSSRPSSSSALGAGSASLDEEAIRARIRARLELVDEGDYFSILGVSRDATAYEVRRAFIELRRSFEPTRILSPRLIDLADDLRKIVVVLEEAYEILRDGARRERYRRAIDARPG